MRVGIITIFSVPNYGAVLQAYALSSYLRKTGHAAETIDYRQPALEAYFKPRLTLPPPVRHWMRISRFRRFVRHKLPRSRTMIRSAADYPRLLENYDAFITGSDQVWFTGAVQYYDPMFFLDFPAPRHRKISYAASVGGTESFGEFTPKVRQALGGFHHVGVRDPHTAELVTPLAPKPPVQTIDPTFLHDFRDLVPTQSPSREPYILVFGDFRGAGAAALQSIQRTTGIRKVVTLQYPCPIATDRIPSAGPVEWLHWFAHADFVLTSYFHGTAFAVKFNRPFLSIPTAGRRIKVATLLEKVGLRERCIMDAAAPGDIPALVQSRIEWPTVNRRLEEQIASSRAFLQNALS